MNFNENTVEAEKNLKAYLVGGAVRDELLGLPVKDRDWVVVGETPDAMIQRGFLPVGRDFPVFLHPRTKEEYALARTERKTGKGYRGFDVISDPGITLEQDLKRRDLTMNAIAKASTGEFIDPFGGIQDLEQKRIRHVSEAFREDPVRILRTAKFAARYASLGLEVEPATRKMMIDMVSNGEVDTLVAERVWAELESVLKHGNVAVFIKELARCHALNRILPEVDALFGIPQVAKYHPEVDSGLHTLMALDEVDRIVDDAEVRFAVMVHDLGKALTPIHELPSHRGHEHRGIKPLNALCNRLRVPKRYRELGLKVCQYHLHCHRLEELKPTTIIKLLEKVCGLRNQQTIQQFAFACEADIRGRTGLQNRPYVQGKQLMGYFQSAISIDAKTIAARFEDGEKIKDAIRRARVAAIKEAKQTQNLL